MDKSSRGKRKLLLVSCAGLDMNLVQRSKALAKMCFQPLQPVFPAVTCTAQATMRTGLPPAENGILCNGRYDRQECRVTFWSQSAKLMPRQRLWDNLRSRGGRVAVLFHQQSLGDTADIVLSPAPIHKHGGGMVEAFQAKPARLPEELGQAVSSTFHLRHYWGPLASAEAGAYCAEATAAVMELYAPELVMTYLPDMDYCLQREGPQGKHVESELGQLANHIRYLLDAADELGYEAVIWGDYSIVPVSRVVYPNRALLKAGLFAVREVNGRQYQNLYEAKAFAMTDHQVAHVFVEDGVHIPQVQVLLASLPGVAATLTPEEAGLSHPNCGELVLLAEADSWFAYQWWDDDRTAPDYANHVDIHSKIGYDPCELFWEIPFFSTATDCGRVRGSHGRADAPASFHASHGIDLLYSANTLPELAAMIKDEVIG